MNFKDEYKKEEKSIVPDSDFLNQLQQTMEKKQQPASRFSFSIPKFAAAAAVIGLIAVSAIFFPKASSNSADTKHNVSQQASTSKPSAVTPSVFGQEQWFSKDMSESEIAATFYCKLTGSDLSKLYHNTNNTFSKANLLSDDDCSAFCSSLYNADETFCVLADDTADDYVAADYYMASFSDGTIIKFSMNEAVIYLPDADLYLKR